MRKKKLQLVLTLFLALSFLCREDKTSGKHTRALILALTL